jgi:hypothetical protein
LMSPRWGFLFISPIIIIARCAMLLMSPRWGFYRITISSG